MGPPPGIFSIVGAPMPAGWTQRRPAFPADEEVGLYFIREVDSAWLIVFGFVSSAEHKLTATDALRATIPQASYRALRFGGPPVPSVATQLTNVPPEDLPHVEEVIRQPAVLGGTMASAAEATFLLKDSPQRCYIALIQSGRRYVLVLAGRAGGDPPEVDARDLARRIGFDVPR